MAKIYGQLEKAQVENVGALPTAGVKGRVVFLTTDSRFYYDDGSNFVKVVSEATTDTLTNKTFDADGTGNSITNIENADIKAAANIARTKLASGTASHVLINDGSGVMSSEASLAISRGGTGQATANAGFNALSPMTTKGDLVSYSTTAARLGVGTDGQVLTADSAETTGIKWAAVASAPTHSYDIVNCSLSASVAASALTISLKDQGGSDPSGGSPVKIGFRSSTSSNGTYNTRSITSALSVTVSSGSTLGHTSGATHFIWVYAIDNSGTVELAVSTTKFEEGSLISTTAEGGAGAADSGSTVYSTTSRSNVPFRILGRLTVSQTTAGTWASAPSVIITAPNVSMLPDPIIARYTLSVGESPNAGVNTYLNFDTKDTDTHGAVSVAVGAYNAATGTHATSEWVFTAPRDGFVQLSVDGQSANYTVTADTLFQLVLETNSTFASSRNIWSWNTEASVSKRHYPTGSYGLHLRKGQTIKLYMSNGHGSALNLMSSGQVYIYMNSDGR